MGSEEKQSCTSKQYCLPTFGLDYPSSEQQPSPLVQFYRPVEVQSHRGSRENGYSGMGRKITATLINQELWKKYTRVGNEMIITTMGRHITPNVLVALEGLDPELEYQVLLHIKPEDKMHYQFINQGWCAEDEEKNVDLKKEWLLYTHPSSPKTGDFWMEAPVNFSSAKIAQYYGNSKNGNLLLQAMHKYSIEVIVHPVADSSPVSLPLPDTTFVAVPAFQNVEFVKTKLHLNHNSFSNATGPKLAPWMLPLNEDSPSPPTTDESSGPSDEYEESLPSDRNFLLPPSP